MLEDAQETERPTRAGLEYNSRRGPISGGIEGAIFNERTYFRSEFEDLATGSSTHRLSSASADDGGIPF